MRTYFVELGIWQPFEDRALKNILEDSTSEAEIANMVQLLTGVESTLVHLTNVFLVVELTISRRGNNISAARELTSANNPTRAPII